MGIRHCGFSSLKKCLHIRTTRGIERQRERERGRKNSLAAFPGDWNSVGLQWGLGIYFKNLPQVTDNIPRSGNYCLAKCFLT
jgi:hypothetical protein